MQYEAVLLDQPRGHHRRGVGPNPTAAVLKAFREIAKFEVPEGQESQVDNIGPADAMNSFRTVLMDDVHLENPATLKEDIHDIKILVRFDRNREALFTPCGFIRPII